ncbi:MAG TPA: hypothetical protein VIO12_08635, partial [Thermoanaerobaculia bacterium]
MRKPTNEKIERNALRLLAVVSLAGTLTAFGCTTNRMPGNGQPAEQTPAVGPANTSSTPGSSSGTTNPPMASDAIVDPTRPSAVDAQATLAADQGYQGRVLGAVSPPLTTQGNAPTAPTGQFANPALIVNPQSTVNSSVSSAVMAPGITGGPVGGGVGVAGAPTALTTVPMSGDATNGTGTSAAAMNSAISTTSNATLATPSNSAIATPANSAVSAGSNSALASAPAATSTTSRATT